MADRNNAGNMQDQARILLLMSRRFWGKAWAAMTGDTRPGAAGRDRQEAARSGQSQTTALGKWKRGHGRNDFIVAVRDIPSAPSY